jgi:replicative superfamily II helicase
MAERVIIVGLRRAGSLIPSNELRQMMGRAGRSHDGEGVVELIVNVEDEGVIHEMTSQGAMTVSSSFSNPDMLAMSLMPEIDKGKIDSLESALVWCARSFCDEPQVEKALKLLREVKAIEDNPNGTFKSTYLGTCSAKFYFHPADIYAWANNFTHLFGMGLESHDVAPAWALGNVPFERIVGDLGKRREIASECRAKMPFGLEVMGGSMINVICWWYLIGGPSPGQIRLASLERRRGFGRYKAVLDCLNKNIGWGMDDFFNELELRVSKGISTHLVTLCRLSGINKTRADYLYNLGIKSQDDFDFSLLTRLDEEIDDDFKEAIRKIAGTKNS